MASLRFALAASLLVACQATPPPSAPVAPADPPPPPPNTTSSPPAAPHLEGGELVDAEGRRHAAPAGKKWIAVAGEAALIGTANEEGEEETCEVVDARTLRRIKQVTTQNTAAGGSNVHCTGLVARGKIVLFENSRGVYPKFVADDQPVLGCGNGIYADDGSSCVNLDTAPQVLGQDAPFVITACAIPSGKCRPLETVPHGLARNVMEPRPWDAAYCSDKLVAVRANGRIVLHELPSGRSVGERPAQAKLCP